MEKIEVKFFESLKVRYGNPEVYLVHTEEFTLIAIPQWNWSFLWELSRDVEDVKLMCVSSLMDPMFLDQAENFADELHNYLRLKN